MDFISCKHISKIMGAVGSILKKKKKTDGVLSEEARIEFIKNSPFFMYLSDPMLKEFAHCFPAVERVEPDQSIKLRSSITYILAEGELQFTTILPDAHGKVDSQEYLCKKRPGDIVSQVEVQRDASRKLSMSTKKLIKLVDDVKTSACSKSILLCGDSFLLNKFLEKHPVLKEPVNAIVKSQIDSWLKPLPFLRGIKESHLKILAATCRYEAFDAGDVVFEQDTSGSKLYIVLSGAATVVVRGGSGGPVREESIRAQKFCRSLESAIDVATDEAPSSGTTSTNDGDVVLAHLKQGSYFGEAALIVDVPRTTTVKAKEKSLFVSVDKTDFRNFLKLCQIKDSMTNVMKERLLCKLTHLEIPFLQGISEEKMKSLIDSTEIKQFNDGEIVFNQGDEGDRFYIIVHGNVKIETQKREYLDDKNHDDSNENDELSSPSVPSKITTVDIGSLGMGKYFGEMALVSDKPRSASISSLGKSLLFSIDKQNFHHIFGENKQALAEFELRLLRGKIELHQLLGHPSGVSMFREFLLSAHAEENLNFWLRVTEFEEKFRTVVVTKAEKNGEEVVGQMNDDEHNDGEPTRFSQESEIAKEAKDIYVKYCDEHTPEQVNIPGSMRDELKKRIFETDDEDEEEESIKHDVFSAARHEIYRIMVRDSYPRFRRSPEFKKFFDSVGIILD